MKVFFLIASLFVAFITFQLIFPEESISISEESIDASEELIDIPEEWVNIGEEWYSLLSRLQEEGLDDEKVLKYFESLDKVSEIPMGTKILELYGINFIPDDDEKKEEKEKIANETPNPNNIPFPWYTNVVTEENAQMSRDYILKHEKFFEEAQEKYGVPPEIGAAILFVETRLGTYDPRYNALEMLASMSTSTEPNQIESWFSKLPGYEENLEWMESTMVKRSDWAFKELSALLEYAMENNLDPFQMPSSVYGAIGYCQFIPSSVSQYAVDGNDDDMINLFEDADAIASLSNFLDKHGWESTDSMDEKIKILRYYNNTAIYGNTVLALSLEIAKM